jgi:subtilisin family serine protease
MRRGPSILSAAAIVAVCVAAFAVGERAWASESTAVESDPSGPPHWVFFRDHDASPPGDSPRARAIPDRDYVAAVASAGATIRTESRWLNAVSVIAANSSLAAIRALPFVAEVRPVARGRGRHTLADAPPSSSAAVPAGTVASADALHGGDVAEAGPSYPQLARIGIPEAHALGYHGEGIVIGVLDTGFALEHEAFRGLRIVAVRDFVQGDDDPRNDRSRLPRDPPRQHDHGTQVLSLLAGYVPGRMIGAAYGASYLLAKTERTDVEQPFEEDLWCAGLEWAEAMGADLVTTSITFDDWYRPRQLDGRTAVTTRVANLAWERGLLLVNAAGNYGPGPSTVGAPGDSPHVLAAGATDVAGRLAAFSSRGPAGDGRVKPDVVAPGDDVWIADATSRDGYTRGAGTSYAAPLVAGVAALVMEAHPDWGPEAVREAIAMSADRAERPASDYGWGMVDARAAILFPFLEGIVRDRDRGTPVVGATVAWTRLGDVAGASWAAPGDAPPEGAARSDAGGNYTIANLPPGAYRLTVTAAGYEAEVVGPFDVPPNARGVDIALRPIR